MSETKPSEAIRRCDGFESCIDNVVICRHCGAHVGNHDDRATIARLRAALEERPPAYCQHGEPIDPKEPCVDDADWPSSVPCPHDKGVDEAGECVVCGMPMPPERGETECPRCGDFCNGCGCGCHRTPAEPSGSSES